MASALLVSPSELGYFVDETIADDNPRAVLVLSVASDLVRSYVGKTWEAEIVPDAVEGVTLDVAARVWVNPESVESDGVDDVQRRFGSRGAEGFYLTGANKMVLDGLKSRGSGLFTISTTRGDDYLDTIYVPTGPPPSGPDFPWYAADDPLVQ